MLEVILLKKITFLNKSNEAFLNYSNLFLYLLNDSGNYV